MEHFEVTQDQMIQLLRMIRHDYLNHIQVLDGLLKLDQIEGAKHYLHEMSQRMRQEQLLMDLGHPALTLYLFTYRVNYPMIQFEVECTERLRLNDYLESERHIDHLIQLLEMIGRSHHQHAEIIPSLLLRLGKIEDKIIMECDFVGNCKTLFENDWWQSLQSKWTKVGANIEEKVRTDEEWVLEIVMR